MRAKDLAAQYKIRPQDNPSGEALIDGLVECAQEMVREISAIIKVRQIKRGESVLAVIREQDEKFGALMRICVEKNEKLKYMARDCTSELFRRVLQLSLKKTPDVWALTCTELGWPKDLAFDSRRDD